MQNDTRYEDINHSEFNYCLRSHLYKNNQCKLLEIENSFIIKTPNIFLITDVNDDLVEQDMESVARHDKDEDTNHSEH